MKSLQPNSSMCFACGMDSKIGLKMRFYNSGPGEVTADYTVDKRYQGYPGIVHGGVVAAMLDEVTARANMGGENPRFMFTARLNYTLPPTCPNRREATHCWESCRKQKENCGSKGWNI